jgi:hypothetical protein
VFTIAGEPFLRRNFSTLVLQQLSRCPMSEEEIPMSQPDQLAIAIGQGKSMFSNFEYRMAELEEEVRARNGNATRPG